MKKYIYLILCVLFVALVITVPELHSQTCHLNGDTLIMMAASPAFAPLKWVVGQNNMGGYKGMLLFVPFLSISLHRKEREAFRFAGTANSDFRTDAFFRWTAFSGCCPSGYL